MAALTCVSKFNNQLLTFHLPPYIMEPVILRCQVGNIVGVINMKYFDLLSTSGLFTTVSNRMWQEIQSDYCYIIINSEKNLDY